MTDNKLNLNKSENRRWQSCQRQWYVLGAGAIGCLWASKLGLAGAAVTVISREPAVANNQQLVKQQRIAFRPAINEQPIYVEVNVQDVASLREQNALIPHLLLATKSYDAIDALVSVLPLLQPDSQVICLSNGLGFHKQLQHVLEPRQLTVGVTSDGALLEQPFGVTHTGRGKTLLGYFAGDSQTNPTPPVIEPAIDLDWQACENIAVAMWRKFLVNCAINPLTALLDCSNGELDSNPEFRMQLQSLCEELSGFLPISPLAGSDFNILQQVIDVARATAGNVSSMRRDFQLGRRLEIEHLNGYLLRLAEQHAIDCPLNKNICAALLAGH